MNKTNGIMIELLIIMIVLLGYLILKPTYKNNTTLIESVEINQVKDTSEQVTQTYNLNGKLLTYPKNWKTIETKNGEGASLNYSINFTSNNGSKGVRLIVHSAYEATSCNNNYRDAEDKPIQCFDIPEGGVVLAEATDPESFAVYESLVNQLFQ